MMDKKRCSGPCAKNLPRDERIFRPNPSGTLRSMCRKCESKLASHRREGLPTVKEIESIRRTVPKAKTYVITYAQNATPVNSAFLESLLQYCEIKGAELIVIPGRYTNPTSIWSINMQSNEWWDPKLVPYLFDGRKTLGGHITIFGDISIQPTASRPLTGFEVFSGDCSAIFGHPKLQLRTIATAKRYYPRILTTTGAVTKTNYTKSKAGKKAEAHHVYGATIVEQGEALFHVRQINADKDGSFIDIDTVYSGSGTKPASRALALICGDIHVEHEDPEVIAATFTDSDSIVNTVKPEKIIFHDVLDFDRRNHHTINNQIDRYERSHGFKADDVKSEIIDAINFLDSKTPENTEPIVIQSNHDEAFDRWLEEADPKKDPKNALFFHQMWTKKLENFHSYGSWVNAFELMYLEHGQGKVRFIGRDESLKVADIYCNFHGDKGLNGSHGSAQAFASLGVKTIVGHSHSPSILDSAYTVGVTSKLDQGYNFLPSSWMNTHCLVYANNTRTLIHVIGKNWKA